MYNFLPFRSHTSSHYPHFTCHNPHSRQSYHRYLDLSSPISRIRKHHRNGQFLQEHCCMVLRLTPLRKASNFSKRISVKSSHIGEFWFFGVFAYRPFELFQRRRSGSLQTGRAQKYSSHNPRSGLLRTSSIWRKHDFWREIPIPPAPAPSVASQQWLSQCPAYFLLMQQGLSDHTNYVPYWFTSESSRDNALSYIQRKLA